MSIIVPRAALAASKEEWIPERMDPGTIYLLENRRANPEQGNEKNPFVGVFSCPRCGRSDYITILQIIGYHRIICGSLKCPAVCSLTYQSESDELKINMHPLA